MSPRRKLGTVVAILGVAIVLASGSEAAGQVRVAYAGPSNGSELADGLHERAAALFTRTDRYVEAAGLLVRAARLRQATDATAVKELVVAAKLYAYASHTRVARATMEDAAERALSIGNVVAAAHAYLDAAFLAIEEKDWDDVWALSARAERLAASPHIDDGQRVAILSRINPARLLGAAH